MRAVPPPPVAALLANLSFIACGRSGAVGPASGLHVELLRMNLDLLREATRACLDGAAADPVPERGAAAVGHRDRLQGRGAEAA